MKKILVLFLVYISILQSVNGQKRQTYQDSARAAKDSAKLWLKAYDAGAINVLKRLSAENNTVCDLKYLVQVHKSEGIYFTRWGKANWYGIKRDTVDGVRGLMITASFDLKPGEKFEEAMKLPLFVHLNNKGKWVVDVYMSDFCFCESPCDEEELPKVNKNDY